MSKVKDRYERLFGEEWYAKLENLLETNYWKLLGKMVADDRWRYTVYPLKDSDLLFKAFRTTPLSKVKVIILGQDPYHDGSYDGFAFSNQDNGNISPSLRNILKEVESDIYDGFQLDQNPNLQRWAEQGILLINTAHTVRKGQPASHLKEWFNFTQEVVDILSKVDRSIVWLIWGKKAEEVIKSVKMNEKHLILTSPHPSPFSAYTGFFGNKHFSKTNKFLENGKIARIYW